MSTGETFNEVAFRPVYSDIESRSEIDTSTNLGGIILDLPIISANMKDITGPNMVLSMAINGGMGILHRFGSIEDSVENYIDTVSLFNNSKEKLTLNKNSIYPIGVSVGVKEYEMNRFDALYEKGAKIFTVDVAHGHHILVKNMIQYMRNKAGKEIYIIAGNIATVNGAKDLKEWGADIIKVGIGPGARCVTRKNTGVGVPQLKAIRDIKNAYNDLPIISDGGIRHTGDIPKALKYSDSVMVGSYIAGTSETPGHVFENDDGKFYKVYGGSASGERKVENGNKNNFVEGVVSTVEFRGHVKHILRKTKDCLQSSMSYAGSRNLEEFRLKSVLENVSSGYKSESRL